MLADLGLSRLMFFLIEYILKVLVLVGLVNNYQRRIDGNLQFMSYETAEFAVKENLTFGFSTIDPKLKVRPFYFEVVRSNVPHQGGGKALKSLGSEWSSV